MTTAERGPLPTVTVAELPATPADVPFLLDVREDEEWVAGHIPGAVHVPMGELAGRLAEVPREGGVVVVCRSGHRSAAVTGYLHQQGYDVRNLDGGMAAWAAAGRPMESLTGAPPTVA